ncbi:MAG: hypothetical protein M3Z98_01650 [Candidatus Dormibacteraeota bacterium]|nr:hypothetical protein [Candidatus Dormibacteraeota bacterium]
MDRETALSRFDSARDAFLTAFKAAPDGSLTYLRNGDIYAIGGLIVHCNQVLRHYRRVLEGLDQSGGSEFRASDPPAEVAEADRRALAGLASAERSSELAELDSLHQAVKQAAQRVPAAGWEEKTPVVYGGAADAYPTSPDDVIGWLRDHYEEHVPHAEELLAEWRATQAQ